MFYISSVLAVTLNVLLVSTHACPEAKCQVLWTPVDYPNPRSQSGLCGRGCNSTYVCDPCSIIGKHEADEIDQIVADVKPKDNICGGKVDEYVISVAFVNRIDVLWFTGFGKGYVPEFAANLRKRGWNFGTGNCGNDVIIVLSRYDMEVYTLVGDAASKIINYDCISFIYEKTESSYLSNGQEGAAIKYMVEQYKHALITGSCAVEPKTDAADVAVWTIIGIFMAVVGTLLLIGLCLAFRSW